MQPGDTGASLFGPLTVHVVCLAQQSFSLYVFRSFGRELYEMLWHEAQEFGLEVV